MSDHVQTVLMDLPTTVRGFVTVGSDYEPCIVINARMTKEQQKKTWFHEMNHIEHNDLDNPLYNEYGD